MNKEVLDSILPEDIYKCTDTGSIWYGCILINDTSFKVDSFGSLKINNIKRIIFKNKRDRYSI